METVTTQQVLRAAAVIVLGFGAGFDLRKQALPGVFLAAVFVLGSILAVLFRDGMPWTYLISLLPGLFLLSLVPVTRGGIGAGDGLLMLGIGTLLPVEEELFILLAGLLLASLYAAVLLLRRRGRDTAFPLVPFILGGCLLLLLSVFFV